MSILLARSVEPFPFPKNRIFPNGPRIKVHVCVCVYVAAPRETVCVLAQEGAK